MAFNRQSEAVRVFFPDRKELQLAKKGQGASPAALNGEMEPRFNVTRFKLDYLTDPNGLGDMGFNLNKVDVGSKVQEDEKVLVRAYPSFQVQEFEAISEMHAAVENTGRSIIVFNGELERYRNGYYPALFYRKIAQLSKTFLPRFTQAYYFRNIKGRNGGIVFRVYGEPWQVYVRTGNEATDVVKVWQDDERPSLVDVARNILPNAQPIE